MIKEISGCNEKRRKDGIKERICNNFMISQIVPALRLNSAPSAEDSYVLDRLGIIVCR